jgi:hypothetical protein
MATRPDLRVGDADREATAAMLREHYAQGRLSLEEFNERLNATFTATTQRDLDEITMDLPHVRTPAAPLPVTGTGPNFSGPNFSGAGDSRSGAGPGARGNPLRYAFGVIAACAAVAAIWLFALGPTLGVFRIFGAGRWGVLAVFLLLIRSILRRVFGRGMGGRCSSRPHRGHYHHGGGYGPGGRRW